MQKTVTATWVRCQCARCSWVWRMKVPISGMLDARDKTCPTCKNGVFTVEFLRFEMMGGGGDGGSGAYTHD